MIRNLLCNRLRSLLHHICDGDTVNITSFRFSLQSLSRTSFFFFPPEHRRSLQRSTVQSWSSSRFGQISLRDFWCRWFDDTRLALLRRGPSLSRRLLIEQSLNKCRAAERVDVSCSNWIRLFATPVSLLVTNAASVPDLFYTTSFWNIVRHSDTTFLEEITDPISSFHAHIFIFNLLQNYWDLMSPDKIKINLRPNNRRGDRAHTYSRNRIAPDLVESCYYKDKSWSRDFENLPHSIRRTGHVSGDIPSVPI